MEKEIKKFRSFESAREFVRALKLKGSKEWQDYYKSGNKPDDIPSTPNRSYKKDWEGMGDWLGNEYRPFTEAKKFARSLKLNGQKEWQDYCKSGNKPDDIPTTPYKTYKKDFKGVGDWLGTGSIATQNKQFLSFKEAREFVRSLGLKNSQEWHAYCASGNKPDDIPSTPNRSYKKDFKGLGDWLGTGTVAPKNRKYRPYKEAKEFARSLNLENYKEWYAYCKSGDKPDDIPSGPEKVYKNKEWEGWGDFLGTGTIATYNKQFLSFEKSKEFARSLNLKGVKEWYEYCVSGNKPEDIPAAPHSIYKNKGWISWENFLGNEWRPFTEAREFVRKLGLKNHKEWQDYCKSGDKPDDIPAIPWNVYKEWKKK